MSKYIYIYIKSYESKIIYNLEPSKHIVIYIFFINLDIVKVKA